MSDEKHKPEGSLGDSAAQTGGADQELHGSVYAILQQRLKLEMELAALDQKFRDKFQRNITIMFTDIKGSTAYFENYGDVEGRAMVQRHNALLFPKIQQHKGRVIKTIGDAIMAAFDDPVQAVKAAIEMQKVLADFNAKSDQKHKRILVRMGLNYGPAVVEENDVFGDAVNVSARVESKAAAGEILISEDLAKEVKSDSEIQIQFFGDFECKGKADPVQIYRVLWRGQKGLNSCDKISHKLSAWALFIPINATYLERMRGTQEVSALIPSSQEYRAGKVARFDADDKVINNINKHKWASIFARSYTGKTTLAFRLAMSRLKELMLDEAYYFDLKDFNDNDENKEKSSSELEELCSSSNLIVIDNVHHYPDLAWDLYDQWFHNSDKSRLLLIGTRLSYPDLGTKYQENPLWLTNNIDNPPVDIEVTENNLKDIMLGIAERKYPNLKLGDPPQDVLAKWMQDYGALLTGFGFAVLERLPNFQNGEWNLPPDAAAKWVYENWLRPASSENRQNQLCLAVLGMKEFELKITKNALPYPEEIEKLISLGHVVCVERGAFSAYKSYKLHVPGWGEFILKAAEIFLKLKPDIEEILYGISSRDPFMAIFIGSRMNFHGLHKENKRLWKRLAMAEENMPLKFSSLPLRYFHIVVKSAVDGGQIKLADQSWSVIESDQQQLAQRAYSCNLDEISSFMKSAGNHKRNLAIYWEAIESDMEALTRRAWATKLDGIASFMGTAYQQSNRLPLDIKERHWNNMETLWKEFERDENNKLKDKISDRTTNLGDIAAFISKARDQGRNLDKIWLIILSNSPQLIKRVWETPLEKTAVFIREASNMSDRGVHDAWINGQRKMIIEHIWNELENNPPKMENKIYGSKTKLGNISALIKIASDQNLNLGKLWTILGANPQSLIELVWATNLNDLSSFISSATGQEKMLNIIWDELKSKPEKLSSIIIDTSMSNLAGFFSIAPDEVLYIVLERISLYEWKEYLSRQKNLSGATRVAQKCKNLGRNEFAEEIIVLLSTRQNHKDFPPQQMGFSSLVWLLTKINEARSNDLLEKLSDNHWFDWHYNHDISLSLSDKAQGLFWLALFLPSETIRMFERANSQLLITKMTSHLRRFSSMPTRDRCILVQFWGGASLCQWQLRRDTSRFFNYSHLADILVDLLPHRPEINRVEDRQYQLWVGLRAIVAAKKAPLVLDRKVIESTLRLWRVNLAETAADAPSALNRINELNTSMAEWLERCAAEGALMPHPLPKLWEETT